MTIQRIITTPIQPGKKAEAIAATKAAARYANEHFVGHYEGLTALDGNLNRLIWFDRFASMAEFEQSVQQRKDDAGWNPVIQSLIDLLVWEEREDHFFKVLE